MNKMNLAIKDVKPQDDYKLLFTFANEEVKLFNSVRVHFDSIEWANKLNLDPELLYNKSVRI